MANTFTTDYMNLTLPTVEVQVGPLWAANLNDAIRLGIDSHDHTAGKGKKVPTAGLDINADLDFQSNDILNARSLQLVNNVSNLPSSDALAVYSSNGNLFYNNSLGIPIQLTTGSSINTGALALNVWSYQAINASTSIPNNASYIYLGVNTSTAKTITLPAASSAAAGRYFIVKDRTGTANTNAITVSPGGADTINNSTANEVLNYSYGSLMLISDGTSNWQTFREGSPGATASALGTIKLAGDLTGSGSTFNTPRVVDATSSVKGKIQLAGDLQGAGSSSATPTIHNLTGGSGAQAGAVTMGSNPAQSNFGIRIGNSGSSTVTAGITARNNTNTADINLVGVDSFNRVQVGSNIAISTMNGGQRYKVYNLSGSGNYNLDSTGGTKDSYMLVNPTTGAISIGLPAGEIGRRFTIKDISGNAQNNNIQIYCAFDSKLIEGLNTSKLIQTAFGCITLIADQNGNWWMV